jgi:hypothetical protein
MLHLTLNLRVLKKPSQAKIIEGLRDYMVW